MPTEPPALLDHKVLERQVLFGHDQPKEPADLDAIARIDSSAEVKILVLPARFATRHGFYANAWRGGTCAQAGAPACDTPGGPPGATPYSVGEFQLTAPGRPPRCRGGEPGKVGITSLESICG